MCNAFLRFTSDYDICQSLGSQHDNWSLSHFFLKEANTAIIVVTQAHAVKSLCCDHYERFCPCIFSNCISSNSRRVDNKKYHFSKISNWKSHSNLRLLFSTLHKCVHHLDVGIKIECSSEDRSVLQTVWSFCCNFPVNIIAKSQCSATARLRFHQITNSLSQN